MGDDCAMSNIIEQAMKMEEEGREFYLNAAGRVSNALGKKMLESLADDESGHYTQLEQMLRGESEAALGECKPEFSSGALRVRAMFKEFGVRTSDEIAAETGDLEALNIAMEMERKGYDLYKDAASNTADTAAEKVFIFLAGEEEKHFEVLQNMHRYLSDPANWFLEEEQGLLDGGD